MSYFYKSIDKEAVKGFIYEDLKVLGVKVPKLDKITKQAAAGRCRTSSSSIEEKCGSSGENAVFGVPLSCMDSTEDINIGHIPHFLVQTRSFLSRHLDKEGLFRKTGSVSRQKDLVQHIEEHRGEYTDDAQVNDVTSVVKQFFRAMPEPLIPHILQDAFIQSVQLGAHDSKVYSLALLCLLLPLEHLSVFRYTLEILSDVSSNSAVNKMNAHNLAVCLTPNFFHTKQNSKYLDMQTEAMEICINNVINIGVVPPSITEKVVMLRSLEANQMEGRVCLESSATSTSSVPRKKRSGSFQGARYSGSIVGSIRRSVDKIRGRRSTSVPSDLNSCDLYSCEVETTSVAPQIKGKCVGGDTCGFSTNKRRAILQQSDVLGTPLAKMSADSTDNVFDSPIQHSSMLANHTINSLNSTRPEDSRISCGRKKAWGALRSPFNKRKRSLSAGPVLSPGRVRSSSRTKKLIRRLSGGKRKTPDMVGQRLAFTTEDDVAAVRQRLPSAPLALNFNRPAGDEELVINSEQFLDKLGSDFGSDDQPDTQSEDMELRPLGRIHTLRDSARPKATLRRRAKSADNRPLKRGRPNHPVMGLNSRRVTKAHISTACGVAADGETLISSPQDSHNVEAAAPMDLVDLPAVLRRCEEEASQHASQSQLSADVNSQSDVVLRSHSNMTSRRPRSRAQMGNGESFDSRMEKVASLHEDMFGKPPVHRQHGEELSVQRVCPSGSRRRADRRPPRPDKKSLAPDDKPTDEISLTGSHVSLACEDLEHRLRDSDSSLTGQTSAQGSKVSLHSTNGSVATSGDDYQHAKEETTPPLTVRGARLQTACHADSISNLQEVSKVKQSKKLFDCGSADAPTDKEVAVATRVSLNGKPPRQAPVRIPTVFARNDPRAMRYKMAADAVRRRSVQRQVEEGEVERHGSSLRQAHSPPLHKSDSWRVGTTPPRYTPHIPISTHIVRGVNSPLHSKMLTNLVCDDRIPLREHSPNVERCPASTPKIKSAMLPIERIKSAQKAGVGKSPRSRVVSQRRQTPYSTVTPGRRVREAQQPLELKNTDL